MAVATPGAKVFTTIPQAQTPSITTNPQPIEAMEIGLHCIDCECTERQETWERFGLFMASHCARRPLEARIQYTEFKCPEWTMIYLRSIFIYHCLSFMNDVHYVYVVVTTGDKRCCSWHFCCRRLREKCLTIFTEIWWDFSAVRQF